MFALRRPFWHMAAHCRIAVKRLIPFSLHVFEHGRSALLLILDILFRKFNQICYPKIFARKNSSQIVVTVIKVSENSTAGFQIYIHRIPLLTTLTAFSVGSEPSIDGQCLVARRCQAWLWQDNVDLLRSVTLPPCWVLENNTTGPGDSGWKVRLFNGNSRSTAGFHFLHLHPTFEVPNPTFVLRLSPIPATR